MMATNRGTQDSQLRFDGYTYIITGGARGIGRSYADYLADRGAAVIIADIGGDAAGEGSSSGPAADAAKVIVQRGGRAIGVSYSVTDTAGVDAIIESAISNFGRLDGLVNNAGIIRMGSIHEVSIEEYRRHLDVHFFGTVLMTRAAWPHLLAAPAGRIVNTVSGAVAGAMGMAHYAAAKGAIYSYTRCLAMSAEGTRIAINAVSPAADTRMIEVPGMAEVLPPGAIDHLRAKMQPEWIAPVTAYLLHPECRLQGDVLSAGGGAVSRMAMAYTPGIASDTLSIEEVASRIDEIMDPAGAVFAPLATVHPATQND